MASTGTHLNLEVCVDLMHTSVFCNDGRMTGKTAYGTGHVLYELCKTGIEMDSCCVK